MALIFANRRGVVLVAALLALSSIGCGGGNSRPNNVSISGKVAYANGKPLTSGMIVFNPLEEGEEAPLAPIQQDGSFTFSGAGVAPGEYRVSLAQPEGEAASGEGNSEVSTFPVPERYLQADTSGWKATVKESGNAPFSFTIGKK